MKVVLQKRGLWAYYERKALSLGCSLLITKCSAGKTPVASQEAKSQSVQHIQEAEEWGFSASEEESGVTPEFEDKRSD